MYSCGPNSQPEPVAMTNTETFRLDPLHTVQRTLTTLSDASMITSIEVIHVDCLVTFTTEVTVRATVLQDGDAETFPILDGLLPLRERVNVLLLPFTRKPAAPSAEETSERPANPQANSFFDTIDWGAIPGLIGAKLKSTFRINGNSAN